MTAARLLELSPYLEASFLLLVVLVLVGLGVVRFTRASASPAPRVLESEPLAVGLLLVVVLTALLVRLLWCDAPDQPRWWFAETSVLHADRTLVEGRFGQQWIELLRRSHADYPHESATMMPIVVAFQFLLGPSFHLPAIVGCFWGMLAVVLAFGLGGALRSSLFGLLFAGFVAASPLQITWARLGGLQIGASAHVLLVLWVAYLAGRRRSILLAFVAGGCAWASLYHYYAARVALPLGGLALLAGIWAARPRKLRAAVLIGAFLCAVVGAQVAVHRSASWQALWPSYPGYVGTSGERSLRELAGGAFEFVRREAPRAARAYFWQDRSTSFRYEDGRWLPPTGANVLSWGMESGGLCLAPVALLGLVGLCSAVRHARRDWPWLALTLLGFLLPCLSAVTARRFLIFDLGMCALASQGLLALLGFRWFSGQSVRRLAVGATVFVVALAAYAFGSIRVLSGVLPSNHDAAIPFAESGFGDGRVCLGCLAAGRHWQEEIEQGAFVVLFDTDLDRESMTIPGGMPLYGKLAALSAGRRDSFLEYYSVMTNLDWPPNPQYLYDASRSNYAAFLAERIEATPHTSVVWHFPEATQWEQALMRRLVAAGGKREPLPHGPVTPTWRALHSSPAGAVIRTPWARRGAALAVFRRLERAHPAEGSCLGFEQIGKDPLPVWPLFLASTPDPSSPQEWAIGTWHQIRWRGLELPVSDGVALAIETEGGDARRLRLLTSGGRDVVTDLATSVPREVALKVPTPIGHDCGALVGSDWWVVDPVSGRLWTSRNVDWPMPEGHWVGLAAVEGERLLLASADQSLHLLSTASGRELAIFPASVPPSRRIHFGECTPVVIGDAWVATFDPLRSLLSVYDPRGRALGSMRFDRPLQLATHNIHAARAVGRHLGLARQNQVDTFDVTLAPPCIGD